MDTNLVLGFFFGYIYAKSNTLYIKWYANELSDIGDISIHSAYEGS